MNDLGLPPRRPLPPAVRDRIRTGLDMATPRSRLRAPLSVAAAVAALAAGAVVVGQTTGTPEGDETGATVPRSAPLTLTQPDARTNEDLDRCAAVVGPSPVASEYGSRPQWQPVFTVTRSRPGDDIPVARVTPFRVPGGDVAFCVVEEVPADPVDTAHTTVSAPGALPFREATGDDAGIHATYQSRAGLMAGTAEGIAAMDVRITCPDPGTGQDVQHVAPPVLQDGLFVVEVGDLGEGCAMDVTGLDGEGGAVVRARWEWDR